MEKITLKDGTEISILDGSSEYTFQTTLTAITDFDSLYSSLTVDNLSDYKVYNSSDVLCAQYTDKQVKSAVIAEEDTNGIIMTVNLKDVDTTEQRITDLEAKVAELQASEG